MGCTRTWFLGAIASEWSVHESRDEVERGARHRCNERDGEVCLAVETLAV
jgi:hypothetical protein